MPPFGAGGLRPVRVGAALAAVARSLGGLEFVEEEFTYDTSAQARVKRVHHLPIHA